jgi:hypothetical protein
MQAVKNLSGSGLSASNSTQPVRKLIISELFNLLTAKVNGHDFSVDTHASVRKIFYAQVFSDNADIVFPDIYLDRFVFVLADTPTAFDNDAFSVVYLDLRRFRTPIACHLPTSVLFLTKCIFQNGYDYSAFFRLIPRA